MIETFEFEQGKTLIISKRRQYYQVNASSTYHLCGNQDLKVNRFFRKNGGIQLIILMNTCGSLGSISFYAQKISLQYQCCVHTTSGLYFSHPFFTPTKSIFSGKPVIFNEKKSSSLPRLTGKNSQKLRKTGVCMQLL